MYAYCLRLQDTKWRKNMDFWLIIYRLLFILLLRKLCWQQWHSLTQTDHWFFVCQFFDFLLCIYLMSQELIACSLSLVSQKISLLISRLLFSLISFLTVFLLSPYQIEFHSHIHKIESNRKLQSEFVQCHQRLTKFKSIQVSNQPPPASTYQKCVFRFFESQLLAHRCDSEFRKIHKFERRFSLNSKITSIDISILKRALNYTTVLSIEIAIPTVFLFRLFVSLYRALAWGNLTVNRRNCKRQKVFFYCFNSLFSLSG